MLRVTCAGLPQREAARYSLSSAADGSAVPVIASLTVLPLRNFRTIPMGTPIERETSYPHDGTKDRKSGWSIPGAHQAPRDNPENAEADNEKEEEPRQAFQNATSP